jgi:glucose-1-phosphate thymidylyltransferase
MAPELTRAVILARGLGSRMRRAAPAVAIDERQARAADTGIKAMIPVGRPFLDYVLSALADAGFGEVCLVIGPEHGAVRDYYGQPERLSRVHVRFAIQPEPLGTSDAVLAAESFAGADEFLVINSDNFYPAAALEAMRTLGGTGLAGFDREALVRDGNINEARVRQYAVLEVGADGTLTGIVEKPDQETLGRAGRQALISMNCWRFGPAIFDAARRIGRSARGEYELADAVKRAIAQGETFRVVPVSAGVLDLSMRGDIPSVARWLEGMEVRL